MQEFLIFPLHLDYIPLGWNEKDLRILVEYPTLLHMMCIYTQSVIDKIDD